MKKNLLLTVLIIFLILPYISAISIEMKDSFKQDEMLTAKLSGEFVNPPLKENIYFYRQHVKIGIDSSISKIGDDYYLFASLSGKAPNNYSLVIDGVSYKQGTKTITDPIIKNFSVTEELIDFIIDKGFVNTKNDFQISLSNFLDESLEVTMDITSLSGEEGGILSYDEDTDYTLVLTPGSNKITFKINITEPKEKLIQFSSENTSYTVPIYLYQDVYAESSKSFSFDIEPSEVDVIMNLTESRNKLIYIYNTGTGALTNVKLKLDDSLKPYVTISEIAFGQILPDKNANINMTILSSGTDGKVISGKLSVETDQKVFNSIDIKVTTQKGYTPSEEELVSQLQTTETCTESGGKICVKEKEECSEIQFYAVDSVCCPGKCNPISSGSSFGKILGWGLIIVIIIIGAWFFLKKYKKTSSPINLLKIAQGKKR